MRRDRTNRMWRDAWSQLRSAGALVLVVLACVAIWPNEAGAIPAFARKYQTSCQTCHVAFPGLTPFGEAFRANGYRFPAGTDASISKDQPVSLGAEGYKKLWPKSVWPGEISGLPPVAVLITSTMAYDRAGETFSFGGMGGEFEILGAGTLGEHFSFWGSVVFARDGGSIATEMERLNLLVRPLDTPELQFKVGSFEPGLMLVSTHRSLMDQEYFALTEPVGDNTWSAEPFQQGIEAYGVVAHRLSYNAGVVEGAGSVGDKSKDVYARASYKVGGLESDGVPRSGAAEGLPANPKPWSEKSVAVSAFAYTGKGSIPLPDAVLPKVGGPIHNPGRIGALPNGDPGPEDPFHVVGGDVAVNYLDLLAHAGLIARKDDRPFLDDTEPTDISTNSQFAEVAWVAYPWLIPAGRWESFKFGDEKVDRVSLTIDCLVRANIKSFIATDWLKATGGKFQYEEVSGGVVIGF
jgi:hypothetical protein